MEIEWCNGWPRQTWLPKVAVVVVAVVAAAVAAVAGLADLAAAIQMSHLCGVKQIFQSFFCFFLSLSFFKSKFPLVRALPEQVQQQQQPKKSFFFFPFFDIFWMAFVCCFYVHYVHIFQAMLSNFSISSSNSKSRIRQIIWVNVHESVQNIFFFMWN